MKTQSFRKPRRTKGAGGLKSLIVAAACLLGCELSQAQTNQAITWSKIAGGGGTSTGGQYSLNGTIGQQDASNPMSGGTYTLTGGFWAGVAAVQTPGAPALTITRAGGNIVLSWPYPPTGYVLQQSAALVPAAWTDVITTPVEGNGIRIVTLPLNQGGSFFRLRK